MAFFGFALCLANPGNEPSWLDHTLAGYAFCVDEFRPDVNIQDPASGFFLVRSSECDGAYVTVLLTRDRRLVKKRGYTLPNEPHEDTSSFHITPKKLPTLATGKGIKIGDSETRLKSILGRNYKLSVEGSRGQFRVYQYSWEDKSVESMTVSYTQAYTFKAGRLIEVQFSKGSS